MRMKAGLPARLPYKEHYQSTGTNLRCLADGDESLERSDAVHLSDEAVHEEDLRQQQQRKVKRCRVETQYGLALDLS